MLECVINISCGDDPKVIGLLSAAAGNSLLDVHSDVHHNRSVFTLASDDVEADARNLSSAAIDLIDVSIHNGVHPRIGAIDVVPFIPLFEESFERARQARDDFALWLSETFEVPTFLYGLEKTLPDIRRHSFKGLAPNFGPDKPHPRSGACAVGVRGLLIAYNLWLKDADLTKAKAIARELRSSSVRTLGLAVGSATQVSMNLIAPETTGPADVWDQVEELCAIECAELVGLIPSTTLDRTPADCWEQLDLSPAKTIEARLQKETGFNRGKN